MRSYTDLDYKITEGFEIADFGKDFEISDKISNQKRTRFQGVSSPSIQTNRGHCKRSKTGSGESLGTRLAEDSGKYAAFNAEED